MLFLNYLQARLSSMYKEVIFALLVTILVLKYISCNNNIFTTDTMSSCQPARSRSNTNQCRPARSRSNNPCQARPNTPRQPRNGQAQTVGGYEEEEEEYSTFRIGCALGVLFIILLGSYNMYSSPTKNVNDNYPYIKPSVNTSVYYSIV